MSRLLLILIGVPLLLIVAAAILVPLLLDKEKVVAMAADTVREQTGAILTVDGDVDLSLFPTIGVSLDEANLVMPEEQGTEVSVRSLQIGVQVLPLLSGRLEIDSINLDGLLARLTSAPQEETPEIDTSGMSDQELEAMYAARREAMAEAGAAAQGQQVLAAPLALNIGRLSITDSRVELRDAETGAVTALRIDTVQAQNLNLEGRPIPLELQLTVEGEQPINLGFDGSMIVAQHLQLVELESSSIEVTGVTAQPLRVELSGPVDIANQLADMQLVIMQGETRGEGSVRYASFESPQIEAKLQLNRFNPALLALAGPEAAASAGDQPAAESPQGDSGDTPLPLDALRSIDTRARLQIDEATFDGHTIRNLKANLRAKEGDIRLTGLKGQLHGGQLDLSARFNARHNSAKLTLKGGLNKLDIATALAAMEAEPLMTGTASMDLTLKSGGRTSNELIQALRGPVTLTTDQVVLKGMALEKTLCRAVALANQESLSASFPDDSALRDLSADIEVRDGKARLNPLRVDLDGAALRGKGNFDLLSQEFKADFDAILSPELSEMDPACEVNERYTAVEWPVECRGSASGDPGDWCSVDTEDILEQLAKNEAKRKVKKEAGKLVEKLFK
jgi:uncharacterized protein involved in outer membrane biogenesis